MSVSTNINENILRKRRSEGKSFCASQRVFQNGEIIYLSNPSGSGKKVYIYRITVVSMNGQCTLDFDVTDKEVSGGTSITIQNLKLSSATSSVCNSGRVYTTASVTKSNLMLIYGGASLGHNIDFEEYLELPQDRAIVFTAANGANNPYTSVTIFWFEEEE